MELGKVCWWKKSETCWNVKYLKKNKNKKNKDKKNKKNGIFGLSIWFKLQSSLVTLVWHNVSRNLTADMLKIMHCNRWDVDIGLIVIPSVEVRPGGRVLTPISGCDAFSCRRTENIHHFKITFCHTKVTVEIISSLRSRTLNNVRFYNTRRNTQPYHQINVRSSRVYVSHYYYYYY